MGESRRHPEKKRDAAPRGHCLLAEGPASPVLRILCEAQG